MFYSALFRALLNTCVPSEWGQNVTLSMEYPHSSPPMISEIQPTLREKMGRLHNVIVSHFLHSTASLGSAFYHVHGQNGLKIRDLYYCWKIELLLRNMKIQFLWQTFKVILRESNCDNCLRLLGLLYSAHSNTATQQHSNTATQWIQ